ncbi:MAG: hypothetical protein H7318_15150 [Oligoflexus sp.]|nr:hypothetical protein [Oligoflexus sp.]
MKRNLWPYLLFALLGAGLAFWVTIEKGPKHEEGSAWESFKSADIKSVSYASPKVNVQFIPLSMSYGWIDSKEEGKESQMLLTGPRAKDFWFHLSPLWASKVLGDANRLKLSDYGLDREDKTFTIELTNGKKLAYRIGGRGFQSSDYFVLDLQKQTVFLWDRMTISLLERASAQLAIESPGFLNPEGLNKITLMHAGKARTLEREVNTKAWRDGEKPIEAEEPLLKWLGQVSKLKLSGSRNRGSANEEPLFSLVLEGDIALHLNFSFDPAARVYVISFGEDKPELLLDEKTFSSFYDEFRASKFIPKI